MNADFDNCEHCDFQYSWVYSSDDSEESFEPIKDSDELKHCYLCGAKEKKSGEKIAPSKENVLMSKTYQEYIGAFVSSFGQEIFFDILGDIQEKFLSMGPIDKSNLAEYQKQFISLVI